MNPDFDEICPPPAGAAGTDGGDLEELVPVHERAYVVRAYRRGFDTMVLRGAIRDQKPPGLYVPNDPDVLTIHHMIVDLTVAMPSLEITAATVVMETHPHLACPRIADHYTKLVGLSIARGFTHKVRELFGGPRGCTHTTALLQAMAPVAVQSLWSFRMAKAQASGQVRHRPATETERSQLLAGNLNTCHVWDEHGEHVELIRGGTFREVPIPIVERMERLGLDPGVWTAG